MRHFTTLMQNDSKKICVSMLNLVLACTVGDALAHLLPIEKTTVAFVLESCLLFYCATKAQCVIFVPNVWLRYEMFFFLNTLYNVNYIIYYSSIILLSCRYQYYTFIIWNLTVETDIIYFICLSATANMTMHLKQQAT